MGMKDGRVKVENDIQHGGLICQGRAAVLRQGVRWDLQTEGRPGEAAVGNNWTSTRQEYDCILGHTSLQKPSLQSARTLEATLLALLAGPSFLSPTTRSDALPSSPQLGCNSKPFPYKKRVATPGLPLVVHFVSLPSQSLRTDRIHTHYCCFLTACLFVHSLKCLPPSPQGGFLRSLISSQSCNSMPLLALALKLSQERNSLHRSPSHHSSNLLCGGLSCQLPSAGVPIASCLSNLWLLSGHIPQGPSRKGGMITRTAEWCLMEPGQHSGRA